MASRIGVLTLFMLAGCYGGSSSPQTQVAPELTAAGEQLCNGLIIAANAEGSGYTSCSVTSYRETPKGTEVTAQVMTRGGNIKRQRTIVPYPKNTNQSS